MTTASEAVSRWSRRFVTASLAWFVCWQVAAVAAAGRSVTVTLGLYGFVLHAIFGKGYALGPTYFDRELAVRRAPAVHLPVATLGTAALAMERAGIVSEPWGVAGDVLWGLGCGIFVVVIAWSVRDNIFGRETGTSRANADASASTSSSLPPPKSASVSSAYTWRGGVRVRTSRTSTRDSRCSAFSV